jgi:large subunit ribosomal protein L18
VLDLGHQPSIKGNSLYAAVQGAREGGLQVPCSPEMFPPPARVKGEHIVAWAKSAKAGAGKPFNACLARGWNPEQLSQQFEQVKKAILEAA